MRYNQALNDKQAEINKLRQESLVYCDQVFRLREEMTQQKAAVAAMQGSLAFRLVRKMQSLGAKLGLRHVIRFLRRVKNGQPQAAAPAQSNVQESADADNDPQWDYANMLHTPEYVFYTYKEQRILMHPSLLSDMHSPCVKGMVSVILPVYNGDDMVALSIESVLKQSYPHFEFIILNDGSTDNTPQIIDEYAKKDKRIIAVHQENQKLPRTLSNGFRLARGEFCTWTSADNVMHEDFLEKLVAELEAHPETGMVYANINLIDENGDYITDNQWYPNHQNPETVMLPECVLELNTYANNFVAAAFMYRASVAHALGDYSPNRYTTEDYDYWMRVNELFNLRHTSFDEPIYDYRFHSKSLTAQDKALKISENRYRLMLWDSFRRSFLLRPLVWSVSGADDKNLYHRAFLQAIKAAGHTIIDSDEERAILCESDYTCTVHVAFDGALADAENLPTNCYKVCVCDERTTASDRWDCLISVKAVSSSDFLANHKGWFSFSNATAMLTFLDVRAKSAMLARMEETLELPRNFAKKYSVAVAYSGEMLSMRRQMVTLLGQNISQSEYEILVVAPRAYKKDVLRLFDSLWQQDHIQPDTLRYVASPSKDLAVCHNAALWAATGEIITFAADSAVCQIDFLKNIGLSFALYPKAAACCGHMRAGAEAEWDTQQAASFSIVGNLRENKTQGCVAFKTDELMLVGGFVEAQTAEGGFAEIGWELSALAQLAQHQRQIIATNSFSQRFLEPVPLTQEVVRSAVFNRYALESCHILPFDSWPTNVLQHAKRHHQRALDLLQENKSAVYDIYSEKALQELYELTMKDLAVKCDSNSIRTRYTYHWIDANGSFANINRLQWLQETAMKNTASPWVSVIVPIYNVEQLLPRCVNSLLHQTLHNIEIILVDDGSPDRCGELCDAYAAQDARVRVIHKSNGGLSDARNAGIDAALGEFYAFIDSDDWVDAEMFEEMLFAARVCDAEIAECSFDNVYPDKIVPETKETGEWLLGDKYTALNGQIEWKHFKCIAWDKLYHKSLFSDGKRYDVGKLHEDEFFTHKVFYDATRLVFIDKSFYHYDHTRETSITGAGINLRSLDVIEAMRLRAAFFNERGEDELYHRMLDLYCWTALDRLAQCASSNVSGERVDQVKSWLREDLPEFKKAALNDEKIAAVSKL